MFKSSSSQSAAAAGTAEAESHKDVAQSTVSFGALRHGRFRSYFAYTMLAMMADNIEHVITYWVIFQMFESPALQGFAVISHWLPFLLFSWYVGALSDRFDCRRVIQTAMIMFMGVTLSWAYLFVTGTLQIWQAGILLVIHGMAGVLWSPGSQLFLHDLVGPEYLQSAVRLNATGRQLGILMGPAVGGGLMLLLGPSRGLIVNALIYLPLTIWLARVPYSGRRAEAVKARRIGWAHALEGLREARSNHVIVSMICLAGFSSLLVGNAFQAQMPGFASDLGTDSMGYGYSALLAANGAGAFVGGVLLESKGFLQARARTAIILALLWCTALGLFSFTSYYPLALALLFTAGFLNLAYLTMAQTLVQLLAPARLRGQLIGLYIMSGLGLRTFSGVTVGIVGSYIGIHWSLGISVFALMIIIVGLLALTSRTQRNAALA